MEISIPTRLSRPLRPINNLCDAGVCTYRPYHRALSSPFSSLVPMREHVDEAGMFQAGPSALGSNKATFFHMCVCVYVYTSVCLSLLFFLFLLLIRQCHELPETPCIVYTNRKYRAVPFVIFIDWTEDSDIYSRLLLIAAKLSGAWSYEKAGGRDDYNRSIRRRLQRDERSWDILYSTISDAKKIFFFHFLYHAAVIMQWKNTATNGTYIRMLRGDTENVTISIYKCYKPILYYLC